jgi:hypothetical protein
MKSYKDEDSGHDYLMDPGCRAVGRPPCTRPGLGLSSPEGTTVADVSPQQSDMRLRGTQGHKMRPETENRPIFPKPGLRSSKISAVQMAWARARSAGPGPISRAWADQQGLGRSAGPGPISRAWADQQGLGRSAGRGPISRAWADQQGLGRSAGPGPISRAWADGSGPNGLGGWQRS